MERLTTRSILGGWTLIVQRQEAVDRLAAYEDTGLEPEEIKLLNEEVECRFLIWVEKHYGISGGELMELVKARDEGRVLPEKSMWTTTCGGRKLVLVMDVRTAIGGGGDG